MPSRRDVCTGPIFSWEYLRHWRRSASLELLHIETECDFGLYRRTEHKSTPQGVLRGAFSGPPTPLKDIPKRNGESRAAGIGLMGGVAAAAYLDLIIRFCPRGLQG